MLKIIIILVSITLFVSCNYVVEDCSGFPNSDLKNIPYNHGEQIRYNNGIDTISFSVDTFYKTEPYEIRGSFPQTGFDDCGSTGLYGTSIDPKFGYKLVDEFSQNGGGVFHITINTPYGNETFNNPTEYYDTYQVNGVRYEEVNIFEKDTLNNSPIIYKIIKASNKGIIQFNDFQNKMVWDIVD